MSNPVFWEKKENNNLSSAEFDHNMESVNKVKENPGTTQFQFGAAPTRL